MQVRACSTNLGQNILQRYWNEYSIQALQNKKAQKNRETNYVRIEQHSSGCQWWHQAEIRGVAVKTLQGLGSLVKFHGEAWNACLLHHWWEEDKAASSSQSMAAALTWWLCCQGQMLLRVRAPSASCVGSHRHSNVCFFPLGMPLNRTVPPIWGPGRPVLFLLSLSEPFAHSRTVPVPVLVPVPGGPAKGLAALVAGSSQRSPGRLQQRKG